MAALANYQKTQNSRLNQKLNDMKTRRLLLESQRVRSEVKTNFTTKRQIAEKKAVNSLTKMIDSKSEDKFRGNIVFDLLVKKIKDYLIDTGRCRDLKSCDEAARKMAAFVNDIMKETCKRKQGVKRSARGLMKSNERLRTTRSGRPSEVHNPLKDEGSVKVINQVLAKSRDSRAPLRTRTPEVKMDGKSVKIDKSQLSNWLADIDSTTSKWSSWISDTVNKAESSKDRIQRGESSKLVGKDWNRFLKAKKDESAAWQSPHKASSTENIRKRGEESIKQWLVKNRARRSNMRDLSNLSFVSMSDESNNSIWSSRIPSGISSMDPSMMKRLGIPLDLLKRR